MSEAEKKNPQVPAHLAALEHWQAQEQAGPPPDDWRPPANDPQRDEWRMPAGWWIIPAAAAGVPLWIALLRLIF